MKLALSGDLALRLAAQALERLGFFQTDRPADLFDEPAELTQAIEPELRKPNQLLTIPLGTGLDPSDLGQAADQTILRGTGFQIIGIH